MVAVFCFCWGPYASFAMINITGHGKVRDQKSESLQRFTNLTLDHQDIPLILTVLPLQLCKTVIVWNPVIFVLMNPMVQFSIFQLHRKSPLHDLNDSPNIVHLQVDIADDAIFQLLKSGSRIFSWIPSLALAAGLDIPLFMDDCLFQILSFWQMCLAQKANDN